MNWRLVGQIAVCVIVTGFAIAPFVGGYLRRRRSEDDLQAANDQVVKGWGPDWGLEDEGMPAYLPRERSVFILPDIPENEFQQNARRAEALGFMDDEPKRA